MRMLVFLLITFSVFGSDINLLRTHKSLLNKKIHDVHRDIAKEADLELECIMSISYSYNEFNKTELLKLTERYKELLIEDKMTKINLLLKSKLPSSYIFNFLANDQGLTQLELIKMYEKIYGSFLIISDEVIAKKDFSSIDEIDSDNIFINKNSTLSDFVSYAYKHYKIIPEKKTTLQLDESVYYHSHSFDKLEKANEYIQSHLNQEMKEKTNVSSNKARELASQNNFGVILFLNKSNKVIGGFSFNSETGNFIKLILI